MNSTQSKFMVSNTIHGDLPTLTLSTEEMTEQIYAIFKAHPGSYYFTSLVATFSDHLLNQQIGFSYASNTTYVGIIHYGDQARVREIVWDMIISRYLTMGGHGHNE
ncbi:hypothetical protein ASG14_06905 [Pedobacter sp. Leaf194]|nr:hypothetical protein ASG14_06905 [Pedobacter sp. Leaf194]